MTTLPALPGHPEMHTYTWTALELKVIEQYGRECALAALAAQWMPIETAPKDGTLFLCWVYAVRYGETDEGQPYQQDASQVDFCQWRIYSECPDGGYFDPCCGQIGDSQSVTHWMPLPQPPKDSQ